MFIRSHNLFEIIGRLGADPRDISTQNASSCAFSVAVSEIYRDQDGSEMTRTTWVPVSIWGKNAENALKCLAKGDLVFLSGVIATREASFATGTGTVCELRVLRFEALAKARRDDAKAPGAKAEAPSFPKEKSAPDPKSPKSASSGA